MYCQQHDERNARKKKEIANSPATLNQSEASFSSSFFFPTRRERERERNQRRARQTVKMVVLRCARSNQGWLMSFLELTVETKAPTNVERSAVRSCWALRGVLLPFWRKCSDTRPVTRELRVPFLASLHHHYFYFFWSARVLSSIDLSSHQQGDELLYTVLGVLYKCEDERGG